MAAHNWRTLRQRGLEKGTPDLMAMPSLHVVLDMAELLGTESALSGVKTDGEAESKLGAFYRKLYKPDLATAAKINGAEPAPPGFSDEETEASFDAFLSSIKG